MSITGSLEDFSLPEILQFIGKGRKTGLLTLRAFYPYPATYRSTHYIWVSQGHLVAAAPRLDHQGLVNLITQQQWVSDRVVTKLTQLCPTDIPLGLYLKNQGVLRAEQLEHLFHIQVLQQVCAWLPLPNGQFQFDQNVPLPTQEMTGLSILAGVIKLSTHAKDVKDLPRELKKPNLATTALTVLSLYSGKIKKPSLLKKGLHQDLNLVVA